MDNDGLPEHYTPESLRQKEPEPRSQILYAIGYMERDGLGFLTGSYGMSYGPVPDLLEMLEIIGTDGARLFRFNIDGTDEIIYEWEDESLRWNKV